MITKEALDVSAPYNSKGTVEEEPWGTPSSYVHRSGKTVSPDIPNLRQLSRDRLEEPDPFRTVDLRHKVKRSTIVWTIFIVCVIISAELFLLLQQRAPVVLRYVLIPFAVWFLIGLSSFVFRRQSRKLMMTGYLEFYRKSSFVWKVSYGICSSAFAVGTTILILSQDNMSPDIHFITYHNKEGGRNKAFLDLIFVLWLVIFSILIFLYGRLLLDYVRHNKGRALPDGVNPTDYRALSDVLSVISNSGGKFSDAQDDYSRRSRTVTNGELATLSRQAVTIRYLQKQLKLLMDELLRAQQSGLPVSRSLDERFLRPPNTCSMWEYQQICHEKKLLESECQTYKIRLHSTEQELTGLDRKLEGVQGIRQKLEEELVVAKDALSKKHAKVKELEILLEVEREAADQARLFIENLTLRKDQESPER